MRRQQPRPCARALRAGQRGMSPITVLLVCGMIGFCMLMVFRIAPIYIADATVSSAMKGIEQEANLARMSAYEIRNRLQRHFDVNDIDAIKSSDVKVTKDAGELVISIEYETRRPLIYNLDVVAHFTHEQRVKIASASGL